MFDIKTARALSMTTSKTEKKLINKIDKKIEYSAKHGKTEVCVAVPLNMDENIFRYVMSRYTNSGYRVLLNYRFKILLNPNEIYVSSATISWKQK